MIIPAILTIVACVIAGFLLGRSLVIPLRFVTSRVRESLASGNFSVRIPVRSREKEVQDLVTVVNQMLERNAALAKQLRTTFDNVAHDLRTPVTRLRAAAEVALQDPADLEACREALADCLEESERVLQILNSLMDVAEAESGSMRLRISETEIGDLVDDVIDMYREVAEEKEVLITNRVPHSLACPADEIRLRQALGNLLDNAIKYNRRGGWVTFEAEVKDNEVIISVSDSGAGVAEGETEKIWERLYRSERSRSEKGLGLGLSFVKAIAEAHGGRAWVTSMVNEGSTFYVSLPAR